MPSEKSLILVTVDCLRADHVGFMGYDKSTTPFLDQLAQESIIFEQALVAGMPTYYSFPAILASRYPLALGRDLLGLAPGEPTLATTLKHAGYATAAFLAGNPYLSRRFNYHQGFDTFNDFLALEGVNRLSGCNPSRREVEGRIPLRRRLNQAIQRTVNLWSPARAFYDELYFRYCIWVDHRRKNAQLDELRQYPAANVMVESALSWLNQQNGHPFFLWLHMMDPHHPYYPPAETLAYLGRPDLTAGRAFYLNQMWKRGNVSTKRLRRYQDEILALYDAGIRWVDEQVKRLVKVLQEQGLWDNTLFVLTSDHGEEFLDHGGRYHYPDKLTQVLVHVPLLIRLPRESVRARFTGPFSLIDLAPTLLDMLGIAQPEEFVGRSRWREGQISEDPEVLAITECVVDCRNPWHPEARLGPRLLAVQDRQYKLVVDFGMREDRLFNLKKDPGEVQPLPVNGAPSVRRRLLEAARGHLHHSRARSAALPRLRAKVAQLKSLLETAN